MTWKASKKLPTWFESLVVLYDEFRKESKKHRCKIVKVDTDETNNETSVLVLVSGIKPQVIPFLPKDLVVNDRMLNEFSSFDVRAITFYALLTDNTFNQVRQSRSISGQEISQGNTIYKIRKLMGEGEDIRTAHELYCDPKLFCDFSHVDIKNIISTTVQEQTIKDYHKVYEQ